MERSEKTWLEKLADTVPGLAGYRAREDRRETDSRLREHLARRLTAARESLAPLRVRATDSSRLELLGALGRLDRTIAAASDALRYAGSGYSGLFDQVKIREAELDRICAHDLALLDGIERIQTLAAGLAAGPVGEPASLEELSAAVDSVRAKIAGRRELFEAPVS